MKAGAWLPIILSMGIVAAFALWRDGQEATTTPEVSLPRPMPVPAPVGTGREPAPRPDDPDPSAITAESRAALTDVPLADGAEAPASEEQKPMAAEEFSLPAEAMLHVGDVLDFQCAMQVMADERFPDAIRALSDDAASEPAALDMRAAIADAYREAFALAGGDAEVASLACGLRICMIEAHLPADTAEDEVRAALLDRLLGHLGSPAVSIELPALDSRPRILRRVFSVSPGVTRTDRTATTCRRPS